MLIASLPSSVTDGSVVESLVNIATTVVILAACLAVVWYAVVFGCSRIDLDWFDRRVRRRVWGLRSAFRPKFELQPFSAADGATAVGTSVAALITDELSSAEPSGTRFERATPDQSASVADALAESSTYLKVLAPIRTRLLGLRRYTIRGTVHPPTPHWRSMTVEIVGRDGRVLANNTVKLQRNREREERSGEDAMAEGTYLLVPLAAAWLVYVLHDIFAYASDAKWQERQFEDALLREAPAGRTDRSESRPGTLHLVGTSDWRSYGFFRLGNWLELLDRSSEARGYYIEALAQDRHNVGAVLNLVMLDLNQDANRRMVRHRLDMAREKIETRWATLIDAETAWTIHKELRDAFGTGLDPRLRAYVGLRGEALDREIRARLGLLPASGERRAPGRPSGPYPAPCLTPLWFRWAYSDTLARLISHVAGDRPPGVDPRAYLEEARDNITRLVQLNAALLFAYRDTHRRRAGDRPTDPDPVGAVPHALVTMSGEMEFVALSLLAGVLNELDLLGDVGRGGVEPATPPPQWPGGRVHRRAFLAGFVDEPDLCLPTVLRLIRAERSISYRARYNLACLYSRRAELLDAGIRPAGVPWEAPTARPGRPAGDDRDSLAFTARLYDDVDTVLAHAEQHLEFARENVVLDAHWEKDQSLDFLRRRHQGRPSDPQRRRGDRPAEQPAGPARATEQPAGPA